MSDNVLITPGSGDTVGADDIASVKYQRVKLIIGQDGTNDGDVYSSNPLPVTGTVTANAGSGTLAVSLASVPSHAVTNAGTFAVQVDGATLTALQLIDDPVATLGTTTYTEASTKGFTIGAVRRDADTTLVDTTNEIGPLQMNAAGQLKVEAFSGETLPVSLASTTITGTAAVTQSGTWTVQPGNTANTTPWLVASAKVASSTNAPTRFANLGANATLNVKASTGNVFSLYCNNENAAEQFIQLHNTATVPAGAAVPLYSFRIPAAGDVLIGTDFFTNEGANFSTGIAFAFSTTKDTYTAGTAGEQTTIIHYA